jgi:hypothetical protein
MPSALAMNADIGAQSRGPRARCLRFAARVAPAPRKTRFRWRASLTGMGSAPIGDRSNGFSQRLHGWHPPFLSLS